MLFVDFKNKIESQSFNINILKVTVCVLAIALISNSFITYFVYTSKRTIITPSTLNTSLSISDIDLSPESLKIITFDALNLLLSYQQSSVRKRFETFLRAYAYPGRVKDIRESLRERLREIENLKMSQSFEPDNFKILEKGVVLVTGRIIPAMMGQDTKPVPVYMKIEYRLVEGSLKILSFFDLTKSEYTALVRPGLSQQAKERQREEALKVRQDEIKRKKQLKEREEEEQYQFDPDDYRNMNIGEPDDAGGLTSPKPELQSQKR